MVTNVFLQNRKERKKTKEKREELKREKRLATEEGSRPRKVLNF